MTHNPQNFSNDYSNGSTGASSPYDHSQQDQGHYDQGHYDQGQHVYGANQPQQPVPYQQPNYYQDPNYGAPQYAPGPHGYPQANVGGQTNVMGFWSIGLAVGALVLSFIPFINWLSWLVPLVGIGLAIAGLAMQQYQGRRAPAIWGLCLNIGVLILIPFLIIVVLAAMFATAGY